MIDFIQQMAWLDPKNISSALFGHVADLAMWLGTENNSIVKQM